MTKLTPAILAVTMLGVGTGISDAADPMAGKEAIPIVGERFTNNMVKGTLMHKDGEYYWIKDTDGNEIRIHVDESTTLDKLVKGDRVKAYITDDGHTTTFQRDE